MPRLPCDIRIAHIRVVRNEMEYGRKILLTTYSLVLILYGAPQCAGQASNSTGDLDTAPSRCMAVQNRDICGLIQSTTHYQLVITNRTEDIVETLRKTIASKSTKCSQFIAFSVCFYSFRDCDPSDGSQLLICEDRCSFIISLYQECVDVTSLMVLKDYARDNDTLEFLEFATTFNCMSPETYIVPDVHINETNCADLSFLDSLTAEENQDGNAGFPSTTMVGLVVGIPLLTVTLMAVVGVLVVVVCRLRRSKLSLERRLSERVMNDYRFKMEDWAQSEENCTFAETKEIRLSPEEQCYYEERFENAVIALDNLEIADVIGEGTFGVVCRGMLISTTGSTLVAIKTAKNLSSKDELRSLLTESLLMKRFNHPNVVGLLGVCFNTPEGSPYLILPFMVNGNVRDHLKNSRVHISVTDTLPMGMTEKTLLNMCLDIAKGMEYLSENKFVHRDLAARNCMLDENYVVKVGDFGLARDVYSHLYYRANKHSRIPVKWAAPEMLNDGICTEKSDVWSFGVTCWEVFSLGSTPYPGITNYDIPPHVADGGRLQKPHLCSGDMHAIMLSCWSKKPEERPNFKQLVTDLLSLTG